MEDLKEMFAQIMKFQMESQKNKKQKNKTKQNKKKTRKSNNGSSLNCKQQEALFKSLSNNQPTDSTTIFTQNAVWNALEIFSYVPDEDKTFEAYYRRYQDIYITDSADWTDAKKSPATSTKASNSGTQQVRRLYLTKKKKKNLRIWLFRNS